MNNMVIRENEKAMEWNVDEGEKAALMVEKVYGYRYRLLK